MPENFRDRQAVRYMERMCALLPPVLSAEGFTRGTCILHTRLATMLARQAGVRARPLRCNVIVANAEWLALAEELDRMPELHEWRGDEWSLGIGHGKGPDEKGYDGHVVVLVEERWVLDLTLDQASRPQRGIELRWGYFEIPNPATWLGGDERVAFRRNGCFIQYEAVPEDHEFLTKPDWTEVRAGDSLVRRLMTAAA